MARRVVTGHDSDGRSVFVSDGPTTRDVALEGVPTFRVEQVWSSPGMPEVPAPDGDPVLAHTSFFPAAGGTRFVVVTFPPPADLERAANSGVDLVAAQERFFATLPGFAEHMEPGGEGMHTTQTVDYGVVLSGEVWLELDDGAEVRLTRGDCVVQNGTRHAWHNRSAEETKVAFVVVGATKA